ncbi:MAG: HEAT repeat domain-containing protein [Polyangiaceae bacterium]
MEDPSREGRKQEVTPSLTRLYEPGLADHEGFDFRSLVLEARSALKKQHLDEAIQILFVALQNSSVREGKPGSGDYIDAARLMLDAMVRAGQSREALTLRWYLNELRPDDVFDRSIPAVDQARTRLLILEQTDVSTRDVHHYKSELSACAEALEHAGHIVRAAMLYESAEAWREARALWSRLAQTLSRSNEDHYNAALAWFNLFRTSKKLGDDGPASRAAAEAIALLEEAADRFESSGVRERAFDCFQVMIEIGREMEVFEHIQLGFSNRLRILREDQLRHFALRTYGEAIEIARAYNERRVAASLAREMASFARDAGETAQSQKALLLEASLWREVADTARTPTEAEHALLLSLAALGELRQLASMREVYTKLASLELDQPRIEHYQRAIKRFEHARDEAIDTPLTMKPRRPARAHAVWHVDLLEWEGKGNVVEATADILLDRKNHGEVTRRRALVARLVALSEERDREGPIARRAALAVCKTLAPLELYAAMSPFEHLAKHESPLVRVSVVRALGKFLFKRTFITIREALEDRDSGVVAAAVASIQELRFPHAFDPLARIFRESSNREARHAALTALTKIDGAETAELLLEVLSFGLPEERSLVVRELRKRRTESFNRLARSRASELNPSALTAIREITSDDLRIDDLTALDSCTRMTRSHHVPPLLADARSLRVASEALDRGVGEQRVSCELSFGRVPAAYPFLLIAGIDSTLDILETGHPSTDQLRTAHAMGLISDTLWRRLSSGRLRFDLDAALDGMSLFAGEPVVTLEGPLADVLLAAAVLSPRIIRATTVATRTARAALGSHDRVWIDGSSVSVLDGSSTLLLAHAAFLGGVSATTSVLAGERLGIPIFASDTSALLGVAPTSSVEVPEDELIVREVSVLEPSELLDALHAPKNEPIVLLNLDAPLPLKMRLDIVAIARDGSWTPMLGWSGDAAINPGRKIIVRYEDDSGRLVADVLHLANERIQPAKSFVVCGVSGVGAPLPLEASRSSIVLTALMRDGRRIAATDTLDEARRRALQALATLPQHAPYAMPYPVGLSPSLYARKAELLKEEAEVYTEV